MAQPRPSPRRAIAAPVRQPPPVRLQLQLQLPMQLPVQLPLQLLLCPPLCRSVQLTLSLSLHVPHVRGPGQACGQALLPAGALLTFLSAV